MPFISFSCLTALYRTSILNSSDENVHLALFLILGGKHSVFHHRRNSLLFLVCWVVFIRKGCWILSFFGYLLRWSCGFALYFITMVYCIDFFHMLNQLCIPMVNLIWSRCIILFRSCCIWFATYFLRIFAHIFMRDL